MISVHLRRWAFALLLMSFVTPFTAYAHVKWFAAWSFDDSPVTLGDILTPIFLGLAALTVAGLVIAVFIDHRLRDSRLYQRIEGWFDGRREFAPLVLRIGLGMTLVLAWADDRLLTPDLALSHPVWGWIQFGLALLLIFPRATAIAGAGTLGLYVVGIVEHGAFYMLDYFIFVGVGVYLMTVYAKNPRLHSLRIPALYFGVGFSLMWVAIEKIIYPQWGLGVLAANPQLTLGLDANFFLLSAGFVELALGYLLIIGLLERPLAVVITLVFFTTTLVFGKVEVIGHTIIHAALIVFLLEGTSRSLYPAPINIHRTIPWRMGFAAVNFVLLLAALIVPYLLMAQSASGSSLAYLKPLLGVLWRP